MPQLLLLAAGVVTDWSLSLVLEMGCGRKGLHQTVTFPVTSLYFQRHLVHLGVRSDPRYLVDILEALRLRTWESCCKESSLAVL